MRKNYSLLNGEDDRKYTELDGNRNVKITPFPMDKEVFYQIEEKIDLDTMSIYITFYANRLGKAVSSIKNSYFDFLDAKEIYNAVGAIQYKIDLLERIQTSLRFKQQFNQEETKITR